MEQQNSSTGFNITSNMTTIMLMIVTIGTVIWFASQMSSAIQTVSGDVKTLREEVIKEIASIQKNTNREINYKTDDSLLRAQVESQNELFKRDLESIKDKLKDIKDEKNDEKRRSREIKARIDDLERTLTQIYSKLSAKKQ